MKTLLRSSGTTDNKKTQTHQKAPFNPIEFYYLSRIYNKACCIPSMLKKFRNVWSFACSVSLSPCQLLAIVVLLNICQFMTTNFHFSLSKALWHGLRNIIERKTDDTFGTGEKKSRTTCWRLTWQGLNLSSHHYYPHDNERKETKKNNIDTIINSRINVGGIYP